MVEESKVAEPKAEPKPEVKSEPRPIGAPDPAELSELARAMASESPEAIQEGSDGKPVPPEPRVASKEGDGDKPPTSKEKPKAKEGDGETKDGEEGKDDPFKGIDLNKPEEALKALLASPKHAKVIQSWSDKGVQPQVQTILQRERPGIEASERERAQIQTDDEHFASMSQEEVAEEISKDPKAAASYAKYQARQQQGAEVTPDGVAAASTVYALVAQIHSNTVAVEKSGLPAEKKAELEAKNFTQTQDGIFVWSEAIQTALIEHSAEARAQVLLSDKWDTFKEERQAEEDPERPPVARGSRTSPVPDLLKEDSETQMEAALAHQTDKK